jgi:hypothetical protein
MERYSHHTVMTITTEAISALRLLRRPDGLLAMTETLWFSGLDCPFNENPSFF